jgi:GTP cyclohydrolase II
MLSLPDDAREYLVAAQILTVLGHPRVRLLSNNPDKFRQLSEHGVDVTELVPTGVHINRDNVRYLRTKVEYADHRLALGTGTDAEVAV